MGALLWPDSDDTRVPFAIWPLVLLTHDREVMGPFVTRRITTCAAMAAATGISLLHLGLLVLLAW